MTNRELIEQLSTSDRDFEVRMKIETDCGHNMVDAGIDSITIEKNGSYLCLNGTDY